MSNTTMQSALREREATRSRVSAQVEQEARSAKLEIETNAGKEVDGEASALSALIKKVDIKGLVPTSSLVDLPLVGTGSQSIGNMLHAFVDNIAKTTPLFVGIGTNPADITPLDVYLHGFIMLLSVIKKYGSLTGSGVGNIPDTSAFKVPRPLAKFLHYFHPYKSGEVTYKFSAVFDIASTTVSTGELSNSFPINTTLPTFSGNSIYTILKDFGSDSIGHLCRDPPPPIGNLLTWLQNRFPQVHEALSAIEVPKQSMSTMEIAPDASAYVATDANDTTTITGFTDLYNTELATVFSARALENGALRSCRRKKILTFASDVSVGNQTYNDSQYICHCFMYHMFHADEWVDGPAETSKLFGSQITTWNWVPNLVEGHGFFSMFSAEYKAARNMNNDFPDTGPGGPDSDGDLWGFATMWMFNEMALHSRINSLSPVTSAITSVANANSNYPQATYNPGLGAALVPPAIKDYINSHGIVIQNGTVIYPYLKFRDYAPGAASIIRTMIDQVSMRSIAAQFQVNPYSFPFTPQQGSGNAPGIVMGGWKFDASAEATLIATLNAQDMVTMFPSRASEPLVEKMMSIYRATGNVSGAMTSLDENKSPFGLCSTMLGAYDAVSPIFYMVTADGVSKSDVDKTPKKKDPKAPLPPIPALVQLTVQQPTVMRSPIAMAKCEVIKGLSYATHANDAVLRVAPYKILIAAGGKATIPMDASLTQSFTPNMIDPGTDNADVSPITIGARTFFKQSEDHDDTSEKSFAQCLASSAASVFGSVIQSPTVQDAGCEALGFGLSFIPVAGPFLRGPSGMLCRAGVGALANYVASRSTIADKDSKDPKPLQTCQNTSKQRFSAAVSGVTRIVTGLASEAKEAAVKAGLEHPTADSVGPMLRLLSNGFSHMKAMIATQQREKGEKVKGLNNRRERGPERRRENNNRERERERELDRNRLRRAALRRPNPPRRRPPTLPRGRLSQKSKPVSPAPVRGKVKSRR